MSTAQHWKNELAEGSILRVRVSSDDFTDQSSLDALQAEFANVEVVPQLDLKPGACLFDLKLGALDASINVQLEKAEEFLLQATAEG
jgi:flagellar biosynthesis/type III secretory pathway protein FliH